MKITLLTAALFASGCASAATPVDGWYTGVFGGYTYFPSNVDYTTTGLVYDHTGFNDGYNAGIRVGYQSNPIRYEVEYTYLSGATRFFNINAVPQTDVSGSTVGNLIMANLYFDGPEFLPSVVPFLGVGIGYSQIETTLNSLGPDAVTGFKADGNEFAYQGTVGLTYNFAENYALNLGYRYAATTKSDNFGSNFQAHMVNAGVVYHFDRGNYK